MKNQFLYIAVFTFIVFLNLGLKCTENPKKPEEVLFYRTKPDKSALFEIQETGISVAIDT